MKKENLENLFQEKFKDFKEKPSDNVWDAIEVSLDKKRKTRLVPIWYTFGGLAAAILITFILINHSNNETNNYPTISNKKTSTKNKTKSEYSIEETSKNNIISSEIVNTTSPIKQSKKTAKKTNEVINKLINQKHRNLVVSNINKLNQTAVEDSKLTKATTRRNIIKENNNEDRPYTQLAINIINLSKDQKEEHKSNTKTDKSNVTTNEKLAYQNNTINTSASSIKADKNTAITTRAKEQDTSLVKKKSMLDDLITSEDEVADTSNQKRWSAGPNIAPVYYNSLNEGSPLSQSLASNSTSGDINFSYGIAINYQATQKLKVRSGLHKVKYSYQTNNILFSPKTLSLPGIEDLTTINFIPVEERIITPKNTTSNTSFDLAEASTPEPQSTIEDTTSKNGSIEQQFEYLEIPIELKYSILKTKFGVDLIGGFSSLLLLNNNIFVSSNTLIAKIGEANNINKLNFSTNIGLGAHYKFTPEIKFNIEPIFKYQLNSFRQNNNFKPFTFGIYSGINFTF